MRVYNFSAGPATMPLEVLERARDELTDWPGSRQDGTGLGMSVLEVSHRSKEFVAVGQGAETLVRELLEVPEDYQVLFAHGGATGQFAAIPLNLAGADDTVCYVNTGAWSAKAIAEAGKFARVEVVADEAQSGYSTTPQPEAIGPSDGAAYLHYTPNETIGGVEFGYLPEAGNVPLVADFSSTIMSRPVEVDRFGLIYAGAQKNLGPAGLCLVIVRDELVGHARRSTPSILDYNQLAKNDSMLNTPPTFAWYLLGLTLQWLKDQGGLTAMAQRNELKAKTLYAAIDESDFYRNPVEQRSRSRMNVPFLLADPSLEQEFLAGANTAGLANLEGHRSVGGMRASIYNAMPAEGVDALVAFVREFERVHG